MFVVGAIGHGLVGPGDTDGFMQGYGPARIDPRLLAYYRCAWAVQLARASDATGWPADGNAQP
jgi:hypothetical protein